MTSMIPYRALLMVLAITPDSVLAGVYKCLDQNKKTFYQDKPCQELTSTGLPPALAKLAPDENRQHLLWKLVQDNRTVFLMASLSYGTADMYPLPESVMDAFTGSSVLAIAGELDTADAAAVEAKGIYSDGSNLAKHIKPTTWQKVLDLAKALNISEEKLETQKPWFAALTLTNAALKQGGYDDKLSVDKTFTKAAGTQKPIVEMGSLDEQVMFLDELPDTEQEQVLLHALRELESNKEYFKSLIEAWKKGDSNASELLAYTASDSPSKAELSLLEKQQARSQALANTISEMAADGRTYFILVDIQHLLGGKGLIAALQGKGFKATQM